jgi:hypothetical protein
MLRTRNNPGFFKGTVVEQAIADELGLEKGIARCDRIDDFIRRRCRAVEREQATGIDSKSKDVTSICLRLLRPEHPESPNHVSKRGRRPCRNFIV